MPSMRHTFDQLHDRSSVSPRPGRQVDLPAAAALPGGGSWQRPTDRLSLFLRTYALQVTPHPPQPGAAAHLLVLGEADPLRPTGVVFAPAGTAAGIHAGAGDSVLAAASVDFGGAGNPLWTGLPPVTAIALPGDVQLHALALAFAIEAGGPRCGGPLALSRLGELLVLMLLRRAIDAGTSAPGVLAGLAHPHLHRPLVALLEAPGEPWRTDVLAARAGLSRSAFMQQFTATLGCPPMAFLARWRMAAAHRALLGGARVKAAAHEAGFTSAAGFSRAYKRAFGHAPAAGRHAHVPASP